MEVFELDDEERELIMKRRKKALTKDTISPIGIGTGRVWAEAKIKGKKFIDEITFVEEEGSK